MLKTCIATCNGLRVASVNLFQKTKSLIDVCQKTHAQNIYKHSRMNIGLQLSTSYEYLKTSFTCVKIQILKTL